MGLRDSLIERVERAERHDGGGLADDPVRSAGPVNLRPVLAGRFAAATERSVRAGLLARLGAALKGRSGGKVSARGQVTRSQAFARWSGGLSTRQRVIVKAHVARHARGSRAAAQVLGAHARYLLRSGAGLGEAAPAFYSATEEGLDGAAHVRDWREDRHHFRFIISAEHGDRIADLQAYVRETMGRVADDLKEPGLDWIAVNHHDTDQPHTHVLVRGRRSDGRTLVIPRAVMGYGFRARAQEHAQELLGDISREQAEERLRGQVQADRETELDRALARHLDAEGHLKADHGLNQPGPYAALLRGRLRHLEQLGLATDMAGALAVAPDFRQQLSRLGARGDVLALFNTRLRAGARSIAPLQAPSVEGEVVVASFHDRALQTSPFVVVRDRDGHEHYASTSPAEPLPDRGQAIVLQRAGRGLATVVSRAQQQVTVERQQTLPADTKAPKLERDLDLDLGL